MKRHAALILSLALAHQPAFAGIFPPRYATTLPAQALDVMAHFATYPPVADQQIWGAYYACINGLPNQSFFWVNGYTQDVAGRNLAAGDGAATLTWNNAIWSLPGGGYSGDGASVFGETGLYPGGDVSLGIPADPNITLGGSGTASVQLDMYDIGADDAADNPAMGAGGTGGSIGFLERGYDGSGSLTRMLSSANNSITVKTIQGYYESSIAPGNAIPSDVYQLKDQLKRQAATLPLVSVGDAVPFWLYAWPSGPVYGAITLGSVGYGAGDTTTQMQTRAGCVTALLLGLGIAQQQNSQTWVSLPAYFNNPYSGYAAYGTTAPTILIRDSVSPPLTTDTSTTFAGFPGTEFEDRNLNNLVNTGAAGAGGDELFRDWADRYLYNPACSGKCLKPNPDVIPSITYQNNGIKYDMEFSSEVNADNCFNSRLDYSNSDIPSTVWQADLTQTETISGVVQHPTLNGYLLYATAEGNPPAYFTTLSQDGRSYVTIDWCVEPPTQISWSTYMTGGRLDYEVGDTRTDVVGATRWGSKIRSWTCKGGVPCLADFAGDAWDGGNVANSGTSIPANITALFSAFNYVEVPLGGSNTGISSAAELQASLAVLAQGVNVNNSSIKSQISVRFVLASSTDTDADQIESLYNGGSVTINGSPFSYGGWGAYTLAPAQVGLGGATECGTGFQANQLTAELLSGGCPISFPPG